MAFNFIKKVFSFGRKADDEKPAELPAPDAAAEAPLPPPLPTAEPAPEPAPAIEAEPDAANAVDSFPDDGGAMQFTPETAPVPDLAPAEPEDRDHAGEPPIAAVEVEEASPSSPRMRSALLPDGEKTPDEGSEPEPETTDVQPPASSPLRGEGGEAQAEPGEGNPAADAGPAETSDTPAPAPLPTQVRVGKTVSREEKAAPAPAAPQPRASWWQRLREGLSRSSSQLTEQVTGIFTKRKLDEDTLQELEDVLIRSDLGVETAIRITDALSAGRYGRDISSEEVAKVMATEITRVLAPVARPLELDLSHKPHVILVVGVNGTGKTTTIGKLAAKLASGGLKVTLAAGDTFRAAAIEQLKIWGERTGSEVVSTKLGADAAGLAYEALERARDNGSDVVIIDTAGRLQNRTELMDELAKVVRVIGKVDPDAPHTVLQTLDATTGQNALNQVEIFRNVAGVNGLVMTKLDGTARGGILVAIAAKHKLPVYFIGVGEGVDDLEPFEAADFAAAIVGEPK